jgi:hypothetical protein
MARLSIASYDSLATASLVARTVEASGIVEGRIRLLAKPGLVPERGDRSLRDQLIGLGVPPDEAQIHADMVMGGAVLVAVETDDSGEELDRAAAILGQARPTAPIATYDLAAHASAP